MPFPSTQEELFKAGYAYKTWERCPACTLDVEVWTSPGKRLIVMEPMPGIKSPATRHCLTCDPKQEDSIESERNPRDTQRPLSNLLQGNCGSTRRNSGATETTQQDAPSRENDPSFSPFVDTTNRPRAGVLDVAVVKPSSEPQRDPVPPPVSPQIKIYGVTDRNMIACGWDDGTLVIQFKYGKYAYANVAEDTYLKIKKNPYPNSLFVKLVKNHPELCPCTKLEEK